MTVAQQIGPKALADAIRKAEGNAVLLASAKGKLKKYYREQTVTLNTSIEWLEWLIPAYGAALDGKEIVWLPEQVDDLRKLEEVAARGKLKSLFREETGRQAIERIIEQDERTIASHFNVFGGGEMSAWSEEVVMRLTVMNVARRAALSK